MGRSVLVVALFAVSVADADERPGDVVLDHLINQCNDGSADACVKAADTYSLAAGCVGQAVHAYERACKLGDKAHCRRQMLSQFARRLAEIKAEKIERIDRGVGYLPDRRRSWNEVQDLEADKQQRIEFTEALIEETRTPGTYQRNEAHCRAQLVAFEPPEPLAPLPPDVIERIHPHESK